MILVLFEGHFFDFVREDFRMRFDLGSNIFRCYVCMLRMVESFGMFNLGKVNRKECDE